MPLAVYKAGRGVKRDGASCCDAEESGVEQPGVGGGRPPAGAAVVRFEAVGRAEERLARTAFDAEEAQ